MLRAELVQRFSEPNPQFSFRIAAPSSVRTVTKCQFSFVLRFAQSRLAAVVLASLFLVISVARDCAGQPPLTPPLQSGSSQPSSESAGLDLRPQQGSDSTNVQSGQSSNSGATTPPPANGQVPPPPATNPPVASPPTARATTTTAELTERINERLAQAQADTSGLPPESAEALVKLYQQALTSLTTANIAREQAEKWKQAAAAAPEALRLAKERAEELANAAKPAKPSFEDLEEGKQYVQGLSANLSAASERVATLTKEEASRAKRRLEAPEALTKLRTRATEIAKQLGTTPSDPLPLMNEAIQWSREAAQRAVEAELAVIESEQRAYEAENTLLPLQIENARKVEAALQEEIRQANSVLETLRSNRIVKAKSSARQLLAVSQSEAARKQLESQLENIQEWGTLGDRMAAAKSRGEKASNTLDYWTERLATMESRVAIDPQSANSGTAFNSWIGLKLRKERGELPDPVTLKEDIEDLREQLRWAETFQFTLEDELRDIRLQKTGIERNYLRDVSVEELQQVQPLVWQHWQALVQSEATTRSMNQDVGDYVDDLLDAANNIQETIVLVDDYKAFIDRNILWIRSAQPFSVASLYEAWEAVRWLISADNWKATTQLAWQDVITRPWWYVVFAVGMAVFILNQASMRRLLGSFSTKAAKSSCTDFRLTARSLALTILISAPLSLTLLFVYWRLTESSKFAPSLDVSEVHILSIANGAWVATMVMLPMDFLRQVCRTQGLAAMHFSWPESVWRRLAVNLRWMIDAGVPLVGAIGILASQDDPRRETSLGRIVFIALMLLVTVFFGRLFSPSSGLVNSWISAHKGGWVDRTRFVWYAFLVALPLAIGVTSAVGYHYTAQRIALHLNSTLWMLVLLAIIYCLLARWLLLSRRKLVVAQARARLEEAARRDASETPTVSEVPEMNLVALNEQTKRLVTSLVVASGLVGIYLIWSEVLPAIDILQNVVLSGSISETGDQSSLITLADVVLVVPIIALVVIAGRNVPGLLEIALLQHLPLTTAAKYAVTTLCRYAIFALGIVLAGGQLGISWDSIQWLIAALGVGLGFGLQEIFANFVSGIILLFEQPLRVGDTITVDGTTGTVSKIRMRATTIVNWDRQELIVPNKDLITGKLLNWTLTDTTNRVVVNVGVAYGSDMDRACEIIRSVCEEHPNIMSDPNPMITFAGFGANSLDIVVRAYLANLENRLVTIHELHNQIYKLLGAAGIEIAFPQRDLHIRSLPDSLSRWFEKRHTQP